MYAHRYCMCVQELEHLGRNRDKDLEQINYCD